MSEEPATLAADFDRCIPAQKLYQDAKAAFQAHAAAEILSRIATGLLKIRAETIVVHGKTYTHAALAREKFRSLDGVQYPSSLPLWTTGSLEITDYSGGSSFGTDYKLFGVRFDPEDVVRMLPEPVRKAEPRLATEEKETEESGPPVSDALLEQWYALFAKAYPNGDEPTAIASAKGMFPGKTVTRPRVRSLRGSMKRGPKPKPAE